MIEFELKHPRATMEHLGYIPRFLHKNVPMSAKRQIDAAYQHGGGWRDNSAGWLMNPTTHEIHYPGDRPLPVLAEATLRDETILVYESGWTAILQSDGSFELCRLD